MEKAREPHSVSLKVLRLSRPSLSQQFPLPPQPREFQRMDKVFSGLYSGATDETFILSPLLTLPPAFGSAYVGETFSCTLSANNELEAGAEKVVTSVKIAAEMHAPSVKIPLELLPVDDEASPAQVDPGGSLQKIVRFELREEGNHILAVNLTYSETMMSIDNAPSSGRVRSFRKLYQFTAQPCLSVRTKVSEILPPNVEAKKPKAFNNVQRFALEAQLENVADGPITLENVVFSPRSPFKSKSINWDVLRPDLEHVKSPILNPQKIWQVAFLLENDQEHDRILSDEIFQDGRIVLGQLSIHWRTTMGEIGSLSTGWLMTRRR